MLDLDRHVQELQARISAFRGDDVGDLAVDLLPHLVTSLGATGAALHWVHPEARSEITIGWPPDFHDDMTATFDTYLNYMVDHPIVSHLMTEHPVEPITLEERTTLDWYETPLYREYFHELHVPVRDQIAVTASYHEVWGSGISLSGATRGMFNGQARVVLSAVAPALTLAATDADLRLYNKLAQQTIREFDRPGNAADFALDRYRIVREVAGSLINRIDRIGIVSRGARLPEPLDQLVAKLIDASPERRARLRFDHGVPELDGLSVVWHFTDERGEGLIRLDEFDRDDDRMGLSRAVWEALAVAAQGHPIQDLPRLLHRSPSSVDALLEKARTWFGVRSTRAAVIKYLERNRRESP